jgi:acetyl-CoA C-acetyltransferase
MIDSYICEYARTPIGAFQGGLSNVTAIELGSNVIKAVLDKTSIKIEYVNEVIMGNVLSANLGQAPARQASIGANLLDSVECMTINKVCGSGLKAVMLADQSIKMCNAQVSVAGGMENMSLAPYYSPQSRKGLMFGHNKLVDSILHDGLWDPYNNVPMGNCGEVLCKENNYTRENQDAYAIESYARANNAIAKGYFKNEISPVEIKSKNKTYIIDTDEEPLRFKKDRVSSLRPAFGKDGTITAANASSLSDGAAAILLANEDKLDEYQLKPIAKIIAHASFANEPIYFTKAPIHAIKKVLKLANMQIDDIDLFEINEAFSCVPLVAMDELKIPIDKLNINGGAVSLGHPIGASGARILVTLINALRAKKLQYGIASVCIGGGEASAMLIEMCN